MSFEQQMEEQSVAPMEQSLWQKVEGWVNQYVPMTKGLPWWGYVLILLALVVAVVFVYSRVYPDEFAYKKFLFERKFSNFKEDVMDQLTSEPSGNANAAVNANKVNINSAGELSTPEVSDLGEPMKVKTETL